MIISSSSGVSVSKVGMSSADDLLVARMKITTANDEIMTSFVIFQKQDDSKKETPKVS